MIKNPISQLLPVVQFSVNINKFLKNRPWKRTVVCKSRVVVVNAKYSQMQMKIQNYHYNISSVDVNFGRNKEMLASVRKRK